MGIVIDNMDATAHITNLKIGKLTTVSSNIGLIPLTTEKIFLNKYINKALPALNAELQKVVITFPSNFIIFELSDLNLSYFDGYVFLGATPTFNPITADPYEEVFAVTRLIKANFESKLQKEDMFL